jgi:hypothetical protein
MNIQSEAERIFEGAAFFNKWLKELTESEKEIVQQMIELSATYEQERSKVLREALEKIVRAWESLPGNKNYAPKEIERWLGDVMSPAIDAAREALAARTERDGLSAEEVKDIEAMADETIRLCNLERRLIKEAKSLIQRYKMVAPKKDILFTKSECEKWLEEYAELSKHF